jgi:hypothetical protein
VVLIFHTALRSQGIAGFLTIRNTYIIKMLVRKKTVAAGVVLISPIETGALCSAVGATAYCLGVMEIWLRQQAINANTVVRILTRKRFPQCSVVTNAGTGISEKTSLTYT